MSKTVEDVSNHHLIIFKAISSFVKELSTVFEKKHSLLLYKRLLNRTTLSHTKSIEKHIMAFKNFCISNREGITSKDFSKIEGNIKFSDKVFINLSEIFSEADDDTKKAIWKHVLTISALVDPENNAKEILKREIPNDNSVESNILTKIVEKVSDHVKPDSDPMAAIGSIMSSGVINDVFTMLNTEMKDGNLNFGALLGSVQGMMKGMGGNEANTGMPDMSSMFSSMLGSLNNNMPVPKQPLPRIEETD